MFTTLFILIAIAVIVAYDANMPQPAKIILLIVDLLLLVLLLFGVNLGSPHHLR